MRVFGSDISVAASAADCTVMGVAKPWLSDDDETSAWSPPCGEISTEKFNRIRLSLRVVTASRARAVCDTTIMSREHCVTDERTHYELQTKAHQYLLRSM